MEDLEKVSKIITDGSSAEDLEVIKKNYMGLIEILAEMEHARWARWQQWVHSQCIKQELFGEKTGNLIIPKHLVERWERQIKTPYPELTEGEKQMDRFEVYSYLPGIFYVLGVKP